MNTIKVYLSTSGRTAELKKDFPVFCGQYQNILLNIYVPTAVLMQDFDIQHYIGQYTNTLNPSDQADRTTLSAALSAFVEQQTDYDGTGGRAPAAGDCVFYIYSTDDTYYRAVYNGTAWNYALVSYFQMGNFAGTSVKIGAVGTLSNGVTYKTQAYYMRYVKKLTYNNVEYALYERKLPRVFTANIGYGQTATQLVVNVVNAQGAAPTVESIVTSQTVALEVMPSTELDQDQATEPSEFDQLWGQLNSALIELEDKQDKQDNNIAFTTGKTVVGALNDLNTRELGDRVDIDDNTEEIGKIKDGTTKVPNAAYADEAGMATNDSANQNIASQFSAMGGRVSALEQIVGTGENFIGTLTITSNTVPLPTPTSALNNFVVDETGRAPLGGDAVIVVQVIENEADKNYKYIFNGTSWSGYEIPAIEPAGNGFYGTLKGTYNVGSTNTVLIDIENGEIKTIYIKISGSYYELTSFVGANANAIANIISGAQIVGEATTATKDSNGDNIATSFARIVDGTTKVGNAGHADAADKATNDGNNNNIANTYLTQAAGATKSYVKNYSLPKEFNNVLYLSANGYTETIPSTPATGVQFTNSTTTIGEVLVGSCEYTLGDVKFELSSKNSYSARLYMAYSLTGSGTPEDKYAYKLVTYAQKTGESRVLLSSELLPETTYMNDEGQIRIVEFGINFSELGGNVVKLETGDKIIQEIYFYQDASLNTTITVYGNSTYPSRMNLNTATQTITYRESAVGEAIVLDLKIADLTVTNGDAFFATDNADFLNALDNEKNALVTIKIPDLSSVTGISESSRIFIDAGDYRWVWVITAAGYTLADFAALKYSGGNYVLLGTFSPLELNIYINAPKTTQIVRL